MGGCSVVGCRNRFTRGKLHFYRFPKDVRRNIWIQFTRKGNEFQPKGSSTICEVHFAKECFVEKKDRVHLSKDAVPTKFFKQTSLGLEMVQVSYDAENHQYFGQECMQLLRGVISVDDEEAITNKRLQKIEELKSLCRFCFYSKSKTENKCLPITELNRYQIDLNDLVQSLGLATPPSDAVGELVCEQCFQQIVEFDLFKKKCREAQDEVCLEIQELDSKIQEIRDTKSCGKPWFKADVGVSADESLIETTIEILEEHLVDDEEFDSANYHYEPSHAGEQPMETNGECIEEIVDGYKIIYQHIPDPNGSDYKLFEEEGAGEIISDEALEACQAVDIKMMQTPTKSQGCDEQVGVDEYQVVSTDDIIKNPERNRFCFRIYECFFCKLVSQ